MCFRGVIVGHRRVLDSSLVNSKRTVSQYIKEGVIARLISGAVLDDHVLVVENKVLGCIVSVDRAIAIGTNSYYGIVGLLYAISCDPHHVHANFKLINMNRAC